MTLSLVPWSLRVARLPQQFDDYPDGRQLGNLKKSLLWCGLAVAVKFPVKDIEYNSPSADDSGQIRLYSGNVFS